MSDGCSYSWVNFVETFHLGWCQPRKFGDIPNNPVGKQNYARKVRRVFEMGACGKNKQKDRNRDR
jgi:hypothetical protein